MNLLKNAKFVGSFAALSLFLMSVAATPLQANGTPVIGAGGIVNAASVRASDLPGGDIAQGSMFSIYGVEMGPVVGVTVTVFPLDNNLAGVEITVTDGVTTVNAIPIFVSAVQINAIMPSNAPLGEVQVRVICNGVASEPETITVVETSVGIFTVAGSGMGQGSITGLDFLQNTSTNTTTPNQVIILWVTGVGGIDGDDSVPPSQNGPLHDFKDDPGMNLQVTVGGRPVTRTLYFGRSSGFSALDQLIVEQSGDIPLGCNVPVVVTARGVTSNSVTMATSANGGQCSDEPDNPILSGLGAGKNGSIVVARFKASVDLGTLGLLIPAPVEKALGLAKGFTFPPLGGTVDVTLDVGAASFMELSEGDTIDPTILSNFISMPPYGQCIPFTTEGLDIIDMGTGGGAGRPLDAGSGFTITRNSGGNATRTLTFQNGTAAAILGDDSPLGLVSQFLGMSAQPLFLNAGTYTAAGAGGSEVGPWSAPFTLAAPVDFGNPGEFGMVNRNSNKTVEFNGGNDTQFVEVAFVNVINVQAEVPTATGVACLARPIDGQITVSSSLLSTIPASTPPDANGDVTSVGVVLVGGTQFKDLATFTAQGLDSGLVTSASVSAVTTTFQ